MLTMNAQDYMRQARDTFQDHVTRRNTTLLPTHGQMQNSLESTGGNSSSGTSVLTNVSPPSSLPAFYAAPPRPLAPVGPPGMSFPSGIPPPGPPAGMSMPPPGPPGAILPPMAPPVGAGIPPPGSNFTQSSGPPSMPSIVPPAGPPVMGSTAAPPTIPVTTPQVAPPSIVSPTVPSAAPITSQPQTPQSPSGSVDTAAVSLGSPTSPVPPDVSHGKGGSWMGWFKGTVTSVSHKVAEKAKTSMDTMITTLDPQMKEFIPADQIRPFQGSGGDLDIIVASDKEVKIGAVREAFQTAFGKATVNGVSGQSNSVAAQPVGFEAALQAAEERINSLRSTGNIHPHHPIVAVVNFIVELTPDCWYEMGVLLLDDPGQDILLQTYTQVTPIPPDYVSQARGQTPVDYPLKATGFAVTIGQIASQHLQVHHTQWQEMLSGVPRRDMILLAARTLAGLYKARLPQH